MENNCVTYGGAGVLPGAPQRSIVSGRMRRMRFLVLLAVGVPVFAADAYFSPPDSEGGWRVLSSATEIRRVTGMRLDGLDEAFEFAKTTSKHGGLLVARRGWLIYERYFGRGHREAAPNTASCGKSFTSVAVGILVHERPDLFPDGLDQRVFTPKYFPPEAFPLSDPVRAGIKLGQLLAMTGGIRGNNPGYVRGKGVVLDPPGPDGWLAMVDEMAFGKLDGKENTIRLWCEPGGGYSYATSSIHLASIMLRHVAGMELEQFVAERLADPLGWGHWGWGYRRPEIPHTPGGGGIALRATDMLRVAYLMLREGRWKDRQIVPTEYVRHCSRLSPYNPHFPYSLQFDVNGDGQLNGVPRDAFWKSGSGGHCLYIVPSLDLVVWKLGGRDDQYTQKGLPPLPPSVPEYDGSRDDWKPAVEAGVGVRRTLQLVVSAVLDDN